MADSLCTQLIEDARRIQDEGKDALVIFDLDGTLYDNRTRTFRIMEEFAHKHAEDLPDFLKAVQALRLEDVEYRMADTLQHVGFTDEEALARAFEYWRSCFFTDRYVELDLPTPGAVNFVNRLFDANVVPVYLTGRDAPNMLLGTITCLQRDGFPVGTVDTRIVLKDRFERPDDDYKKEVIASIRRSGEVIAAFDNEPGLCNMFQEAFPSASVCLLDTSFAPGAPPLDPRIPSAKDFISLL